MARGLPGVLFHGFYVAGQLPQFQSFRAGGLGRKNKEGAFYGRENIRKVLRAAGPAFGKIPVHKRKSDTGVAAGSGYIRISSEGCTDQDQQGD